MISMRNKKNYPSMIINYFLLSRALKRVDGTLFLILVYKSTVSIFLSFFFFFFFNEIFQEEPERTLYYNYSFAEWPKLYRV